MFHVFSITFLIITDLKLSIIPVNKLILGLILFFYACQSEQINWIAELEDKKVKVRRPAISADVDRQLAYIHRFPRDTNRNINLFKEAILTAVKIGDEELTYKLIILSLKKYPKIIYENDMEYLTINFYRTYLKEQETANWIFGIIKEKWNEKEKLAYYSLYANQIKKAYPEIKAYHDSEQIVNMAIIHSLLFQENENSPEFLWQAYQIMLLTSSEKEAINILDLISIRHKSWIHIKKVGREKDKFLKSKRSLKWLKKEKSVLEQPNKDQAPVS